MRSSRWACSWDHPYTTNVSFLAFINKLFGYRFVHIGVSGRSAPLAAPGRSAPDDLFGCIRDIGCRINEGWVLPAEFEENRSQIFCGRLHDDLANLDAAGEENKVEWQLEQFRHLVFTSRDCSNGPRIEIFRNEIQ